MATPRKEKPAETPGYWPTTKMAELFELTARRIQQLTQDGVLKTHDTPAGRRYNVGEATKDYIRYLRTQLDRKASAQNDKLETDKLQAEVDIKAQRPESQSSSSQNSRAQCTELRTSKLSRRTSFLISAAVNGLCRDGLRLIPRSLQVRPKLLPEYKRKVNEILLSLSQYHYDPEEYKKRVKDRQGWAMIEDDEQAE